MDENTKEGLERNLIAIGLIAVFLVITGGLLWLFVPSLASWGLWSNMALNFGKLWLAVIVGRGLGNIIIGLFRLNIYDSYKRLIGLNLLLTVPFMLGWAAFAAQWAASPVTNLASGFLLYVLALLSCIVAHTLVISLTFGAIYRIVNFGVWVIGFIVFSFAPVGQ